MTDATSEMNQAVHQLFEISHSGNKQEKTKTRLHGNTYERKRCLRRIERAVISFQNHVAHMSHDSEEGNDYEILDDALEPLMDILTEFPKLEFSQSDALRDLLDSITSIACSLLQKYASMPFSANHIDRLLDRTATLALIGQVDIDVLQLLNSSLLHYEHLAGSDQSYARNDLNVDCEDEIDPHYSDGSGDHCPRSVGGNHVPPRGSIILNANETLRLTQILMPLSLKHLSQAWTFPVRDDEDDSRIENQQNELATWKKQHGGLQLRVLLGCLLQHFLSEVDKLDSIEFGDDESPLEKLQQIIFYIFQKELVDGDDDANCSAMVEDYIDLITSFLVENIEYAVDVIDTSSHILRQLPTSTNDCENGVRGNTECEIGSTHRYIKDAIQLTSLAIGMIEFFQEDLGLPWETYKSHAVKLLEDFASFVAVYCNDGVLMHAHGSNATMDSADKSLMKLWSIMRDLSSAKNDSCPGDHQTLPGNATGDYATFGSKRRRVLPNENDEAKMGSSGCALNKTMVTTLLRAFLTSSSNEAAMDLIRRELVIAKEGILKPVMETPGVWQSDLAREFSSLMQACALSTLLMPQEDSYDIEESHEGGSLRFNGGLFSTMVDPLVALANVEDNKANSPISDPVYGMVDAMNPWNYLLSRNLSTKLSLLDVEDSEPGMPMRVVTTSSASSVSDLRSHNTSNKKGEVMEEQTSSIIDDLMRFTYAVEHVSTL